MAESPLPYRLLVFDWDGTLMDSIGPIVDCAHAMMADLGLGPVADDAIRATIGLGLRETMNALKPGYDEALFARMLDSYREHWHATFRDVPVLFPDVEATLDRLGTAGYLLAVATGKSRRGLDHALAQTGLCARFHSTRTVDEAFSKPHPKMLLDILEELGVQPGAAAMIGDTTHDLQMAKSAGTAAIAVCSGSQGQAELAVEVPLACLPSVVDLPAWLAGRESSTAQEPAAVAAR
ncbi:MAG TPA: HAD-IA family hydrolase [Thermoanaerobaculia bacterium]